MLGAMAVWQSDSQMPQVTSWFLTQLTHFCLASLHNKLTHHAFLPALLRFASFHVPVCHRRARHPLQYLLERVSRDAPIVALWARVLSSLYWRVVTYANEAAGQK